MAETPARMETVQRRLLLSTVGNYASRALVLGIGFLLTPFLVRELGVDSYGLWVLVGSVVAYGALLDFGMAGAVTKYVAEHEARGEIEQARDLVGTALWLFLAFGLVAFVLSALVAPFFPDWFGVAEGERATVTWLVLLMGGTVGLAIPASITTAVLEGYQRYNVVNMVQVIGTVGSTAAIVVVLLLGGGVIGMVSVNLATLLLTQVGAIWMIYRLAPRLRFGLTGFRFSLVRRILSFSASLFVTRMSWMLQTKTDEITIGIFLPVTAVAPYAIARRLAEVGTLLTEQFVRVLMPLASSFHAHDDRQRLRGLYLASTRLTLVIFLPIGGVILLLAGPALGLWIGPEYAVYAPLVVILGVAGLIEISQWPAGSVLMGMARYQPLAPVSIASGLANLALSLALVQPFGLIGVAVGTLIPTALECLGFVLPYTLRVIGVGPLEFARSVVLPALLPALPMAGTVYLLRSLVPPDTWPGLIALGASGALAYLVSYLVFGASAEERRFCGSLAGDLAWLAATRLGRAT